MHSHGGGRWWGRLVLFLRQNNTGGQENRAGDPASGLWAASTRGRQNTALVQRQQSQKNTRRQKLCAQPRRSFRADGRLSCCLLCTGNQQLLCCGIFYCHPGTRKHRFLCLWEIRYHVHIETGRGTFFGVVVSAHASVSSIAGRVNLKLAFDRNCSVAGACCRPSRRATSCRVPLAL